MIYVPDYESYQCAYLSSSNLIRVYDGIPANGRTLDYKEYSLDHHYIYRDGTTSWGNYSTLPVCLAESEITTNYFYRTDIAEIIFLFLVFVGINYFMISKLVKLFFRGSKVI